MFGCTKNDKPPIYNVVWSCNFQICNISFEIRNVEDNRHEFSYRIVGRKLRVGARYNYSRISQIFDHAGSVIVEANSTKEIYERIDIKTSPNIINVTGKIE